MLEKIKNFFSSLLNRKPFGLYITDEYIQAIQFTGDKKAPTLQAIGQKQLAKGVVVNGELLNEKALAAEITQLLASTTPHPIKDKKCLITIPSSQCYEHIFYLPIGLNDDELKSQLDMKVKESIPLPFSEVKYDYSSHTVGKVKVVYVVAARREIIAQYYDTTKTLCGLSPEILEPESLSLLRNINVEFEANKAVILVDIHGNKISWFEMWCKSVVDSNIIEKEGLFEDLQKSVNTFKANTKVDVSGIYISGNANDATVLAEELKTAMRLPVKVLSQYRIAPKTPAQTNPLQFKIAAGLALKGIGVDIQTEINLLKK